MRRWLLMAGLLPALGAAIPAAADDAADCSNVRNLARTDPARAVAACRRLADQGDAASQHNLGTLYVGGLGVPHDFVEAATWFNKAANQGLAVAQTALGVLYAYGLGVPKDYVQAYQWFALAAAQGNRSAAEDRDRAAGLMTPAQLEPAKALVAAWKPNGKINPSPQ